METIVDQKCCKPMYRGRYFGPTPKCGKPAKMQHEGKFYCGVHDPVKRKARTDAKYEQWKEEERARGLAREAARKEEQLKDDALAAIREIAAGHNNPQALARQVLSATA